MAIRSLKHCDFCFRPPRANVLGKRRWWSKRRWYFVCTECLQSRKWRHRG